MLSASSVLVVLLKIGLCLYMALRFDVRLKAPLIPECSKLYFLGCC